MKLILTLAKDDLYLITPAPKPVWIHRNIVKTVRATAKLASEVDMTPEQLC